jgi:hypothetical protein
MTRRYVAATRDASTIRQAEKAGRKSITGKKLDRSDAVRQARSSFNLQYPYLHRLCRPLAVTR